MFNDNTPINLFFSCDDGYVPFLSVALHSIKENRNRLRRYNAIILHTGISRENIELITAYYNEPSFSIRFENISSFVEEFSDALHTRDYYSKTTYYRLFIPKLFPYLDKALYLDSDIIVTGDISALYDTDLGDNLVGAIPDEFVNNFEVLRLYTENRVGIKKTDGYFNAGVLMMNLDAMRRFDFLNVFLKVLGEVKFDVAQDQDYLNAICKDRVKYIDYAWNEMPLDKITKSAKPKLIHFNLDCKPWQKDGVLYADLFWKFADETPYSKRIHEIRTQFDQARIEKAKKETERLISNAYNQASDERECRRIVGFIDRCIGNFRRAYAD